MKTRHRGLVPRAVRLARKTHVTEGCWEWTGFLNPSGYGVIRSGRRPGKLEITHRVAWEEAFGPIPSGMWVLHHCDNRRCVRPDHLFIGSPIDNIRDMDSKGRRTVLRGQDSPNAKFTDDDVRSIRARFAAGERVPVMAREYGVTNEAIYRITTGTGWKHLPQL